MSQNGRQPAFPRIDEITGGEGEYGKDYRVHGTSGLTKREYFAGQAMDATLATFFRTYRKDGDAKWIPFAARMCFEIADAMLVAAQPETEESKS